MTNKIEFISDDFEKNINTLEKEKSKLEILQQNMTLLQNELLYKNEIIKSLIEIQSSVLYTMQKTLLRLKITAPTNVNHSIIYNFSLSNVILTFIHVFNNLEIKCTKNKIDPSYTNKPLSFQVTSTTETGLSDCHKLISTFMRSFVSRLKPKIILFRNYKKFDETKFLADLKNTNFSFTSADPNENYLFLTNSFSKIVEKHVPLKQKTLREDHAPFVSKELRKAIYTKVDSEIGF